MTRRSEGDRSTLEDPGGDTHCPKFCGGALAPVVAGLAGNDDRERRIDQLGHGGTRGIGRPARRRHIGLYGTNIGSPYVDHLRPIGTAESCRKDIGRDEER
ncbi:MAG: hypothetical protein Q8O26_06670 [Phreatobacter sp.]|uniref:hypothetical protein n=1 Tax=Phreatobacter sp. TaxID=1966341 RepID=UPI0027367AB2|nr:hypothetical protein [Phreatobacter sp.]MDP2801550.1 hypothetical protein [Phreatobacter sp.]